MTGLFVLGMIGKRRTLMNYLILLLLLPLFLPVSLDSINTTIIYDFTETYLVSVLKPCFMHLKIDSTDVIGQLKRGDIIFQENDHEKYIITSINAEQVMLTMSGGGINVKLFATPDLIKEKWVLQKREMAFQR
jgi:hypothetical protein